jgi:UDP-N-acetyl-D-galactosamine dehydrogenase
MEADAVVAVVGLGYVGLPLAVEFGKKNKTIGFDLSASKIENYKKFIDPTGEVSTEQLRAARHLEVTTDPSMLSQADYIVVAVPTPVDIAHNPDFTPLVGASKTVGVHMKRGAIVVFESTVYPGATEEVCIPIMEKESGMKWKDDFHVGFSPERINPGDTEHTLTTILKVVSGDDDATLDRIAKLYESVVTAGVYRASSIKVAEAAKVIENTQRDLNIALMNELAIIFDKVGIDTLEVLKAAGTKWNFLPFRPGLVGGHCIGVDPYYLLHKSESVGYHPDLIHTARQVNNRVGAHVAQRVLALLEGRGKAPMGARILVLGVTFKENCPDLRNSRALELAQALGASGARVDVQDPWVGPAVLAESGVQWVERADPGVFDAVVLAVAHDEFRAFDAGSVRALLKPDGVVYDVKSVWPRDVVDDRL